ncbi:MAG: apolipoprotein N-acyltransferase [Acidimicrobiales bacterium]
MKRILAMAPPIGAGVTLALSMPPWGWWPLAFVSFAWLAVQLKAPAAQTLRSRYWIGFGFGAGWLFPATFWMIDLTPPGYVVQGLIFAVLFGVATLAAPPDRWQWLALPATFTLVEALRWRWPFGGVPLATIPMSQVDSFLGETVRILGPFLLTFLVVLGGMAIAAAIERSWTVAGSMAAIIIALGLLAQIAPDGAASREINIAIVQGGGEQGTRAINTDERLVFERHLEATNLIEGDVDLVLWPEDVVNVNTLLADSPEYGELQDLARQLDAWLIAGIFERIDESTNANASIAFSPEGVEVDRYDKVRLVPFGETVPLRGLIEPLAPDYLPVRDTRPGAGEATLDIEIDGEPVTLGVNISWEVFFEDRARDAIGNGGEILTNPTNGSSYWLTILQTQQVASSKLRAMETGRWVLQAAPTGFSAVVTPDGALVERTAVSETAVIEQTVELRDGQTIATRAGPWPMVLISVVLVGLSWFGHRRLPQPQQ